MTNMLVSALSGLNAAMNRLDSSAARIAQAGAVPIGAHDWSSEDAAGVQVTISDDARQRAAQPDQLTADIVEQRSAAFAYEANLFSVRIADRVALATIDMMDRRDRQA